MTRAIISMLFLLGAVTLQAQENIDKVMYRIVYKTYCVEDTTEKDSLGNYDYDQDEMALDVGTKVSKFYSMLSVRFAEWVRRAIKHGGEPDANDPQPPGASITWTSYYNYPSGKVSTLWDDLDARSRTEEPITPISWKIVGDTCTLLGYHCTKAEAKYKGRQWTAWYTEDIPIDQGPWQLGGLPGMILKACDSRRQWIFTAMSLEQINGKEELTLAKYWKKYELISKSKFYQWRRTTTKDDMIRQMSAVAGVKLSYVNKDGEEYSPEEYRKEFMSAEPFNPLDLSE